MVLEFTFKPEEVLYHKRTSIEAINAIKLWLDHTNLPKIQDELIILFLLSCNNVIEATKKTITAYYRCKKNSPELFDDCDVDRPELVQAMSTVSFTSIPVRTKENFAVHCFKITDSSISKFNLTALMKVSYMLLDITLDKYPPAGLVVVMDMKGATLMHLMKLKYGILQKYIEFLQEAFPIQLKVIHIINAVYFIDKIMAIIKMFMKSEIMDMIKIHKSGMDMTHFFENCVPANCMPNDYGGECASMLELNQICNQQLRDKKQFYIDEESMRKNSDLYKTN